MDRLLFEIEEQPTVLEKVLNLEKKRINEVAKQILKNGIKHIYIAARGSSDNVAIYAKYVLGIRNNIPVGLAAPSIFTIYDSSVKLTDSLVVGISQSGQSPDVVSVIQNASKQGCFTIAITNKPDSPLGHIVDEVLFCNAGPELSVAATKTYSSQLFIIAMLSASLLGDKVYFRELKKLPCFLASMLEKSELIKELAGELKGIDRCVTIGRGYNYCTAFEYALKLKELTYILAMPYSTSDFLHGPIAILRRDFPCLLIAPSGRVIGGFYNFSEKVRTREAMIVVVSDNEEIIKNSDFFIRMPTGIEEWLSPIVYSVSGQLLSYYLAKEKGIDPEQPIGLSKITKTV